MNATLAVHRIDRERATLHKATADRIRRAARAGQPIAESIERLAMLAYLRGMKRSVTDASDALKRDVRVSHLTLSREDEKRERDLLLWLIAYLGLPAATVETIRAGSHRVALNAAEQLRAAGVNAAARAEEQASHAGRNTASQLPDDRGNAGAAGRGSVAQPAARSEAGRLRDPSAVRGNVASPARGNVATRPAKYATDAYLRSPASPDVFGRFGLADVKLPPAAIDTWAETVAYSQYERGRWDAANQFPAISEALWGYRWSSVLDNRTTTGCRILDGWAAPVGDTYMQQLRPPRHFNCRAVLVPVYQSSRLKKPVEVNRPSDATLARYLEQKEQFLRYAA